MVNRKWSRDKTKICDRGRIKDSKTVRKVERGKMLQRSASQRVINPEHIASIIERVLGHVPKNNKLP